MSLQAALSHELVSIAERHSDGAFWTKGGDFRPDARHTVTGRAVAVAGDLLLVIAGEAGIDGLTVGEVLDAAADRYGPRFAAVVGVSAIWVNGDPAVRATPVGDSDEVAVLPPVSGG